MFNLQVSKHVHDRLCLLINTRSFHVKIISFKVSLKSLFKKSSSPHLHTFNPVPFRGSKRWGYISDGKYPLNPILEEGKIAGGQLEMCNNQTVVCIQPYSHVTFRQVKHYVNSCVTIDIMKNIDLNANVKCERTFRPVVGSKRRKQHVKKTV